MSETTLFQFGNKGTISPQRFQQIVQSFCYSSPAALLWVLPNEVASNKVAEMVAYINTYQHIGDH